MTERLPPLLTKAATASTDHVVGVNGGPMQIPKFDVDTWFRQTGVWTIDGDCYSARHGMIRTPSAAAVVNGAYAA